VWLAHEAQRIITVSRFMGQHLQDSLGVAPSKIDVIYNGVTLPHGEEAQPRLPDVQRRSIRQRYAPNNERLICYVGRLVYEKGAQTLLAALPQVRERIANVKLVIAGTGPMAEQLQHQAAASGVADHVIFAGYISDAERNQLYGLADVAVFPSLYEPFGIVALEAMSFGCPVVVSKTGGLAEIVEGHETGIVVEPGNPGSLAWGILHTLEHPKWAAARATNALRDLATTYSWRCIAEHTIATYRHVLAQWRDDAQAPLADPRRPARRATNGANRSGEYARG
jgi:glycosyltransferase involved in cell wall biosynthesis